MQFSLFKTPDFIAFFSSFVSISRDEDMQFSRPLQVTVPSFSPLIHSFFHEISVCGICIYIYNKILSIKTHPYNSAAFALPSNLLFWDGKQTLSFFTTANTKRTN